MAEKEARLIVLTGVTRGLGAAMLRGFSARGHRVIGCGRSRDRIAELSAAFERADLSAVDVSSDAEVTTWSRRVLANYQAPDLLVNNAALINANAALWDISAAEFGRVIDVNIKGVHNVIRGFVPAMVAAQSGVIVNLSSGWGRSTAPEVAPYCATKWAIEGLSRALAQELPSGMASVAYNPGIIDTEMLRSCFGKDARDFPGPEQWAEQAVPFLLSLGPADNGRAR